MTFSDGVVSGDGAADCKGGAEGAWVGCMTLAVGSFVCGALVPATKSLMALTMIVSSAWPGAASG